jgi:RNA polymerase sigma factor (sigma-70 family)
MDPSPRTSHFARLLDRIRAGDPAAKEQLIGDAYERVRAQAHYILKGRRSAPVRDLETGEVVSLSLEDFLVRLREGLTRVPHNPAEMFGYVDRVIRNVVIDEIRRRNGPKFQTQFPKAEIPSDHQGHKNGLSPQDALQRLMAEEAIAQLPWDQQMLFDMRYRREMSPEEIATELGCDPTTARRQLRKILLKLRGMLGTPDENDEP